MLLHSAPLLANLRGDFAEFLKIDSFKDLGRFTTNPPVMVCSTEVNGEAVSGGTVPARSVFGQSSEEESTS